MLSEYSYRVSLISATDTLRVNFGSVSIRVRVLDAAVDSFPRDLDTLKRRRVSLRGTG